MNIKLNVCNALSKLYANGTCLVETVPVVFASLGTILGDKWWFCAYED